MDQILRRAAGLAALLIGAAGPPAAPAQDVRFLKLPREAIESRLRDCPPRNRDRWPRLIDLFKAAGAEEGRIRRQPVPGFAEPNIVCTLPGFGPSVVLVGAHFDNIGRGHGVIDNWSGTALLPSLYESLKIVPRRHTFIFAGFAAEEAGLKGSSAFARSMSDAEISRTRALVNLDCLGLGTTAVMPKTASRSLVDALRRAAAGAGLPVRGFNRIGFRWDADSFGPDIRKITIHSFTPQTLDITNSVFDNLDAVRWADYYDTYCLLAVYLAYLDAVLE